MTDTDKILWLVINALDDAIKEADRTAPADIDRIKIKKFKTLSAAMEDAVGRNPNENDIYYVEDSPLMLIPFEKLRERLVVLVAGGDDDG